jgi:hypothetical protein
MSSQKRANKNRQIDNMLRISISGSLWLDGRAVKEGDQIGEEA